nr:uncharacterized protein LOC106822771 [Equus asinus]
MIWGFYHGGAFALKGMSWLRDEEAEGRNIFPDLSHPGSSAPGKCGIQTTWTISTNQLPRSEKQEGSISVDEAKKVEVTLHFCLFPTSTCQLLSLLWMDLSWIWLLLSSRPRATQSLPWPTKPPVRSRSCLLLQSRLLFHHSAFLECFGHTASFLTFGHTSSFPLEGSSICSLRGMIFPSFSSVIKEINTTNDNVLFLVFYKTETEVAEEDGGDVNCYNCFGKEFGTVLYRFLKDEQELERKFALRFEVGYEMVELKS